MEVLLKCGANPSDEKLTTEGRRKKKKGRRVPEIGDKSTPLHLAARYGLVKVIKLLLLKGVHVDPVTRSNQTPLHLAAIHNQVSAAKILIERYVLDYLHVEADVEQKLTYDAWKLSALIPLCKSLHRPNNFHE